MTSNFIFPFALLFFFLIPRAPLQAAGIELLPPGKSQFTLETRGKTLEVFTYRPEGFTDGPLFVVMHGMNRNPDTYRDAAVSLGDRFKALIVAPGFDLKQFPVEAYQRGGVTLDGKAQAKEKWTFQFVGDVLATVREREKRPDMPCYLIGHSAGGQFLNRLAAFLPGEATRIVSCNPGTLIFPTRDMPFQYGFGKLPGKWSDDEWIRKYLASPLTLFLGTADTDSKNLDQTAIAMSQGASRLERGRACYRMAKALAAERGWEFNWTLVEAEGVAHSSADIFAHPKAAEAIFGKKGAP